MNNVIVSGSFNDINSRMFRFLHEASRMGRVEALLWSDELVETLQGAAPEFSLSEREYVLDALRYVDSIRVIDSLDSADSLPEDLDHTDIWAMTADEAGAARQATCSARGLMPVAVNEDALASYPEREMDALDPDRKTVIVTGCYDWFHSGHVRFFEEVSAHGQLYVVVGHDANIQLLKGEGHPMFPEDERRYMAQSIRFVHQAFISTGHGWMDAEPEIERLKPDAYAVNEDGDRPEKREFCAKHGLEYIVLKREPKPGLTRRSSTDLRGF
jgi:cytidyltransferase-like protein